MAETVVSVLLFNEHPHAIRVRPSVGDAGIDVLVPHQQGASAWDVYQIKKFAQNLTSSQKHQIESSFRQALLGLVRRGVPLADWYLAMPLDPTLENLLDWFTAMPGAVITEMMTDQDLSLTDDEASAIKAWYEMPDRIIEWKGLGYCETLASKHWSVADYYLNGGSERIRNAVADLAKILQRDLTLPSSETGEEGTSLLEPGELHEHLDRLGRSLDGDPHFRYGFSVDPTPPPILVEPGLIAATQQVTPDGRCITFRLFARFDEALNYRPIPMSLRFRAEPGSGAREALQDWLKYGTPLTTTVDMDSGLPGGLGGALTDATIRITPHDRPQVSRRWRIVAPDGTVLAEVPLTITSTTGPSGTGVRFTGRDPSGILTVEGRHDLTTDTMTLSFTFADATGHEVVAAAPAIEFMASLHHPNQIQVADRYGPYRDFVGIEPATSLIPPVVASYLTALAAIQSYTATAITVPDLATLTPNDVQAALRVAALLAGDTVVGSWSAIQFTAYADATIDTADHDHYQLAIIQPLTLAVNSETLTLGAVQNTFMSARLTELDNAQWFAEPNLNDTVQQTLAPDEPVPETDHQPVRTRKIPEA